MEKTSSACFPRLRMAMPVLITATLVMTGCQGGEPKDGNSASQSSAKEPCGEVLSEMGEEAVRRVADVRGEVSYSGSPQAAADELILQQTTGEAKGSNFVDFCRFYKGSSVVTPAVRVIFSLEQEVSTLGKDPIVNEFRMGKSARAGERLGILYIECSSEKFSAGAGATVLVRGESRMNDEITESEAAAQKDNLRIIYESSRALVGLLDCKSKAGLPATFTMPPEV